ncbi:hypothetical protein H6F42_20955 [Pseudanabaena sp. FACHB-1998]|uniref:hypothetical protein n=1 Tax=Pseudanabaena sp. FACHB-1998 TaxID=2692858 RepID=UPI001681B8CF|nr:hypothetical protein [Pseudanabaena sp. FACHB-1998]MBD2179393.1 hypothetical protein [Pseudanabaena sp. FACHB-1998]
MPRKKPKGFAGEKSKHNQEMQKLDQGDNTKGNNPPFWVELFVNVMMISKLISAIATSNFRKPKDQ